MSALDVGAFLNNICTWATSELNVPVIQAYQNAERPPRPYCSVQVIAGPEAPYDDDAEFQNNGTQQSPDWEWAISGWRELVVQFDYYGAGQGQAMSAMNDLQTAPNDITARDFLMENYNIVYVDNSKPRNLSSLEGAGYQTRIQMDVTFRVKSLATQSSIGTVESVEMTNNLNGTTTTVVSPN